MVVGLEPALRGRPATEPIYVMSQDTDKLDEAISLLRDIQAQQKTFQEKFDEISIESIKLQQYTVKRQRVALIVLGVVFVFAAIYLIFVK